ncbi:F-box only protein 36 [Petromyzon marinus]|uniref:F-box only protein 36 n=1 Tax=Petromyzon marinus TaxID=7757 RepID=UPI003F708C75
MAALLPDPLLEARDQAKAPLKDFYQIVVTRSEVIWRWWQVSLRHVGRSARPGETKETHAEFLEDRVLQGRVLAVFGPELLSRAQAACSGRHDFLSRLPAPLGVRVLALLRLEDLQSVARTCTRLHALCESDALWEAVCCGCDGSSTSSSSSSQRESLRALAADIGWKRVFFSSKLHLQLQLRRRRQRNDNSDRHEAQQQQQQLALPAPEVVPAN